MDKIVNYLMKFKFVVKFVVKFGVDERTKGDIEALADARRALKNMFLPVEAELYWQMRARSVSTSLSPKGSGSEGVDLGPRVPSWAPCRGSGWAVPEFELRSI